MAILTVVLLVIAWTLLAVGVAGEIMPALWTAMTLGAVCLIVQGWRVDRRTRRRPPRRDSEGEEASAPVHTSPPLEPPPYPLAGPRHATRIER